jgi:cytochrome c oxidase assembly factor CtaG
MIKLWLLFAIIFAAFYFAIPAFRNMKGKEKWDVVKTVLYSFLCSALAVGVMVLLVFLF